MKRRRVALYFAWSRPAEIKADLGILENRYPALFEFRRALWPLFEAAKDPQNFSQNISGFLDHVILADFQRFTELVLEETGYVVPVIQREGDQPPTRELDRDFLASYDTLIVVSLDHFRTNQTASPAEVEAIRDFLGRENTCAFICPHHDIGTSDAVEDKKIEFAHHQDRLVPAQQRIGGFARSLLAGLGVPVENRWGLNPAAAPDGSPSPLVLNRDADEAGILNGVTTFNLHPHLPHLSFPSDAAGRADILARQQINLAAAPHPFIESGNRTFNALLRIRVPQLPGRVYVGDATLWSSAFGGLPSLTALWRNVARMPI